MLNKISIIRKIISAILWEDCLGFVVIWLIGISNSTTTHPARGQLAYNPARQNIYYFTLNVFNIGGFVVSYL